MTSGKRIHLLSVLCLSLTQDRSGPDTTKLSGLLSNLTESEVRALFSIADSFGLIPAWHGALTRWAMLGCLPQDVREALRAVHLLNAHRNRTLRHQAVDLTATLAAIGVRPVFLKGMSHILGQTYESPAERMMSDIDVLVPQDRITDCAQHLYGLGYETEAFADPDLSQVPEKHQIAALKCPRDDVWVELHKSFFPDPGFLLPATEILAGAEPVRVNGATLWIPCLEHRVTLALAHATVRQRLIFTLKDALDIQMMVQAAPVRFDVILRRFEAAGHLRDAQWYLAAIQTLFHVDMNLPEGSTPWTARQRARFEIAAWVRLGFQPDRVPSKGLSRAKLLLTSPQYRMHLRKLCFNNAYRRTWSAERDKKDRLHPG